MPKTEEQRKSVRFSGVSNETELKKEIEKQIKRNMDYVFIHETGDVPRVIYNCKDDFKKEVLKIISNKAIHQERARVNGIIEEQKKSYRSVTRVLTLNHLKQEINKE